MIIPLSHGWLELLFVTVFFFFFLLVFTIVPDKLLASVIYYSRPWRLIVIIPASTATSYSTKDETRESGVSSLMSGLKSCVIRKQSPHNRPNKAKTKTRFAIRLVARCCLFHALRDISSQTTSSSRAPVWSLHWGQVHLHSSVLDFGHLHMMCLGCKTTVIRLGSRRIEKNLPVIRESASAGATATMVGAYSSSPAAPCCSLSVRWRTCFLSFRR